MFDFKVNVKDLFKNEKKKVYVFNQEEYQKLLDALNHLEIISGTMRLTREMDFQCDKEFLEKTLDQQVKELKKMFE